MKQRQHAFTLIELITVLAVTAILLTIIAIPLIQGFNLTRAAQSFSDAQERARLLIAQMEREISNATLVRDTGGKGGQVNVVVPSDPDSNGVIDNYVTLRLDHAKIDLLVPAEGEPITGPSGALLNPNRLKDPNGDPNDPNNWVEDPTLRTPRGQVQLPVSPGLRLVRYFIGLKKPLLNDAAAQYNNPYDGILMRRNAIEDNLYVLWRAEMELRQFNAGTGVWVVNPILDLDGNGQLESRELDDPNFFLGDGTAGKASRIREWLKRSRIVTESRRYDMVMPIFDKVTRQVSYYQESTDPDDPASPLIFKPRMQSLVQFSPTRVASEPAEGQLASRSGEETDNMAKVGPDVFKTSFGAWSGLFGRLWPSSYRLPSSTTIADPWSVFQPWQSGRPYEIGRARPLAGGDSAFSLYHFTSGNEASDGIETFDVTEYLRASSADPLAAPPVADPSWPYPFSYGMNQADARSGWLANAAVREDFVPFVPDSRSGKVTASFSITEVGNGSIALPAGRDNRPVVSSGVSVTPPADTTLGGVPSATRWQGAAFNPSSLTSTINQRFNVLWQDWNLIAPSVPKASACARFVDLRLVPTLDGEPSPLHPTQGFPRARIVPGSEVVYGPDQIKGANYGNLVRFTRATNESQIGPNQYFINYVNQREPDWAAYGLVIPPNVNDPTIYDPNNFISAILQPRYRAGYLKFNSSFDAPLAQGNIFINYRFQFTEPNDVLAIDYDTRQKMHMTLTIRNFPEGTIPNIQNVTLTGEASVRNYSR